MVVLSKYWSQTSNSKLYDGLISKTACVGAATALVIAMALKKKWRHVNFQSANRNKNESDGRQISQNKTTDVNVNEKFFNQLKVLLKVRSIK